MNKPSHASPSRRTWFTTILGVGVVLLGGLGSFFSLFALLMALGKPYANASSDPLGIFLIFILPPGTLLAGLGLLLRQRWARWWMILLMLGVIALGVKGLVAPTHANPAYAPLPRPATEAMTESVLFLSMACIAVGGIVLLGLFLPSVRREFSSAKSNTLTGVSWRVGHCGRDLMYYEENHGGTWQRLDINGEMLTGRAHHVIYFASPESWQGYPDWARHRRDEIIARIKSRFCEPDYEHQENGSIPRMVPLSPSPAMSSPPVDGGHVLRPILTLLAIAAAAFWFGIEGLKTGETSLPVRHAGNHRVSRAEKPALFWTSIGLIGAAGTASAVGALWLGLGRSKTTR